MTPREKMAALINAQPLSTLLDSLAVLEAKNTTMDDAEKLTRAMIMDEITMKSDEVNTACEKWDSDLDDPRTLGQVILDASKELAS